jgi:nicotinate-nucleotide pyrophosphorylase (carboxylating)
MNELDIKNFVQNALVEDVGRGDLFAKVCSDDKLYTAKIVSKDDGVLSGLAYVKILCDIKNIEYKINKPDGDRIYSGDILLELTANSRALVECERTILNILQHSSGIATKTNKISSMLKNRDIDLLDTRKTRPLLRNFEKYSVLVGGAKNHRMGLDDSLMLKDTHLATISNLCEFIKNARNFIPWTSKIEVECSDPKKAKEAMGCGVDIIMCDNMQIDEIKEVVAFRDVEFKHILIEVSGNITADNIKEYTTCGIDAISTGSLVHQATWLDFSMKIE